MLRVLLLVVVAVVGTSSLAHAEISESVVERAQKRALTEDYQDELPGQGSLIEFELGDPGRRGSGSGGTGGSGSGAGKYGGTGSGSGSGQGSGAAMGGSGSGSGGRGAAAGGTGSGSGAKKRDPRLGNKRGDRERQDTREIRRRDDDNGPMGNLFSVLLWGLLAVGVALLAFWFISEFAKSGDDAALPASDDKDAKAAAQAHAIIDKPLDDADVLAQQGRYVEAIHTLLLRTLHELARSAMVRVERSHTSREILARVPLLADAREALSVLITYVELTHFGDDPATEADYTKCREQFNRFAHAFRAGLAVQQRMPLGGGTTVAA